ncbi:MAG: phosphatidylserine decarboxylase family protein [Nitrospirota bacterium]|nr:phosphatidylserine decarboxylase family protein [Nitrospirota bacterium]MDH5768787.1 phosphatidylserine decarboxylase family protein [Nitrospirota bacterium]
MIKFAPEGSPFIFGSLFITVIVSLFLIRNWASGSYGSLFYFLLLTSFLFLGLTIFMAFFFRDPERNFPEGNGIFVSPADGKVIVIRDIYEKDYLKAETKEISIFMSPLDVHVNRAPCDGKVSVKKYSSGSFVAAYKDDASMKNENIVMVLNGKYGRVLVRQVAGFIARRVVCRVSEGDSLKTGERYGMIKFSSRLDVYLPKDTIIKVHLGDKVKAGESVIGIISTHNKSKEKEIT